MRNAGIIAVQVIKDASRKKLFYIVFLFGIAIVALSPLLPTFELGLRNQFLMDVSLSLTSLFGVVLAVIVSVGQISTDIKNRTLYNIFSKPVTRLQYLLGKYLGILATMAIILAVMGLEIILLIYIRLHVFSPIVLEGVFTVFLEAAVIAAFCLCLSTFAPIPINVMAAALFYILCHIKTGYLHQKLVEGVGGVARAFTWSLYYLIPNLENFNISEQVGYGGGVPWTYMLRVFGYALLFVILFLVIGHAAFKRRNL